jgi:hypothetical protein
MAEGLTRINRREEAMRYRIDREQLSEFLTRQVRLVERLPVEAAEAAADGYGDGLDDAERGAIRRSSAHARHSVSRPIARSSPARCSIASISS